MAKIKLVSKRARQHVLTIAGRIGEWIGTRLSGRKASGYALVPVEDFPDVLKPNKVYLAGEANHYWGAALLCPCGCGETIQLNLLKEVRPCWKVKRNSKGAVTILPSIWRRNGCKSHFFCAR
jgi:hypothetical protein